MTEPTTTDIFQTIFVGGQLVLLFVAAIFGWRQLVHARELREEQTRPFVVIDLDSPKRPFFDLVVKNVGTTMAREVSFRFDPAPESTVEQANPTNLKMFRDGISTLPPGKEIRTFFDSGIQRHDSGLPDLYEVSVSYCAATGDRTYTERIDLDFGIYWGRMTPDRKDVHDLYKQLEAIAKEMGKWKPNLGHGLLAVTTADVEKRNAEALEQIEEYRAEQAEREAQASEESEEKEPG